MAKDDLETLIVNFISDQVEAAGAGGAVLGLSGGLDSATVAFLAARALGPDRITALILPEAGVTPAEDVEDARQVASILGIEAREIEISGILGCYSDVLSMAEAPRVVAGNLKARVRMTILYWHANLLERLVLGTGNKTEVMLGYSTKFGDAAADIFPIAGLYKDEVRALAKSLGVPVRIIEKAPTAGLWPGQTDEGELGISYDDANAILRGMEAGRSREDLAAEFGSDKLALIERRIAGGRHKREHASTPEI
ncbi:MAG TPA: NAD+ synthase [Methanothrix sp.]|nr:NAD+ synthase [Methanothrix sp.]